MSEDKRERELIERLKYAYLIRVVSNRQRAESIRDGNLRLGSVGLYRGIEGDRERGDPDEGAVIRGPGRHFRIMLGDQELKDVLDIAITYNHTLENVFLFCAYSLSLFDAARFGIYRPPATLLKFGEFVVIINAHRFVAQLGRACQQQGKSFRCNFVEYVSDDYHGEWGIFRKRKQYAHQQEFRFAVESTPHDEHDPSYTLLKLEPLSGAIVGPLAHGLLRFSHPCMACGSGYFSGIAAPLRRRPRRVQNKIDKRHGAFRYFQRCRSCGVEVKVVGQGLNRIVKSRGKRSHGQRRRLEREAARPEAGRPMNGESGAPSLD